MSGYSDLDTPELAMAVETDRVNALEVNTKSDVQSISALLDCQYKRVEFVKAAKISNVHGNEVTVEQHGLELTLSFNDRWFADNTPAKDGFLILEENGDAKYMDALTFCKTYHPNISVEEPQPLLT